MLVLLPNLGDPGPKAQPIPQMFQKSPWKEVRRRDQPRRLGARGNLSIPSQGQLDPWMPTLLNVNGVLMPKGFFQLHGDVIFDLDIHLS
jgi:hypothetical protein